MSVDLLPVVVEFVIIQVHVQIVLLFDSYSMGSVTVYIFGKVNRAEEGAKLN